MYRYYSILRPVSPGTIPHGLKGVEVHNFNRRKFCLEIGREVWGYFDSPAPIPVNQQRAYDLIAAVLKMVVVEDVVNMPGTRRIPAGMEVEAVRVLGCPGYFDITAPDGTEISHVNGEKYLREAEE